MTKIEAWETLNQLLDKLACDGVFVDDELGVIELCMETLKPSKEEK